MSVPVPPEGGSFPRRPQRPGTAPPQPVQEASTSNGAAAVPPVHEPRDEPSRRMLAAIEEYAAAREAAGLRPAVWGEPVNVAGLTPEQKASELAISTYIAEIDAGSSGPFPSPLPDLTAPADPDAFLVGGFIRPGTTVMLTGPPGSSKSWAARQLAFAAAAGLDSFLDTYAVDRPLYVVLLHKDNRPDEGGRPPSGGRAAS